MSYTKPKHCIFCGDPESICRCPPEILEFAKAHVVTTDDGRGILEGETLRVLIERAQAWGREHSREYVLSEDSRRIDWLYQDRRYSLAEMFGWGWIPDSPEGFRRKLDEELLRKPAASTISNCSESK